MQLENNNPSSLPLRFVDLKRSIVPQDEESKARLTASWNELLGELRTAIEEIKLKAGRLDVVIANAGLSSLLFDFFLA